MTIDQLIFVGFNGKVAALDRDTGTIVWSQKNLKRGTCYITFLLDGNRLIVSCDGYIYCLNPLTGDLFWNNDMPGYGTGVTSLASVRGSSNQTVIADAAAATAAQQQHNQMIQQQRLQQ
ncbi:TPA: hypothetical protein DDW35_03530 [Candidatus Sumerlaeota bacterium]|jgi:outer membrane protein assembly factor BamB|nr:hypothetical protein [Candidatus Sumerlaeota bacterium]